LARLKSGIQELDEMLMGGFMEGDAVMIAGSAGAGKTTLGLQYLMNGVRSFGETGIYVTFEQLPDQIYRDALSFGWDIPKLEEENKLRVICTSPDLLLSGDGQDSLLSIPVKEIKPKRIVIDSLSHLQLFIEEKKFRLEVYRLVSQIKRFGLSSLLLWESPQVMGPVTAISDMGMSFLVDSIILLKPVEIDSSIRKALVILKMRGSNHDKSLREYYIDSSNGFVVLSPFENFEGILSGTAHRTVLGETAFVKTMTALGSKKKGR
jgi:circadian clock protein KaiC